MKLKFDKNESGEILIQIEGKSFVTTHYIEMIKQIKEKKEIEAEFSEQIPADERRSVEAMIKEINSIKEFNHNGEKTSSDDYPDDLPF